MLLTGSLPLHTGHSHLPTPASPPLKTLGNHFPHQACAKRLCPAPHRTPPLAPIMSSKLAFQCQGATCPLRPHPIHCSSAHSTPTLLLGASAHVSFPLARPPHLLPVGHISQFLALAKMSFYLCLCFLIHICFSPYPPPNLTLSPNAKPHLHPHLTMILNPNLALTLT